MAKRKQIFGATQNSKHKSLINILSIENYHREHFFFFKHNIENPKSEITMFKNYNFLRNGFENNINHHVWNHLRRRLTTTYAGTTIMFTRGKFTYAKLFEIWIQFMENISDLRISLAVN